MPEEQNTEQSTEQSTEASEAGDESTEQTTEQTDEEKAAEEKAAAEKAAEDAEVPPEVLREKVTKANAEAANYRTKLRDAEEKLKNAKSPEEVDEIVKQLQTDRETSEAALLRENVALKFKLPAAAQKRLAGSTREELEADAKELADLFGSNEDDEDLDLEGGLEPRTRESGDSDDPRALAAKHGRRGKRR